MTVVSSCNGVMGAEERCEEKSGHTFARFFFKSNKVGWQLGAFFPSSQSQYESVQIQ